MHIKDSMEQTENNWPISLLCINMCCSLYYYNHAKQFTSPLQHDFLRNRLLHYTAAIYLNAIGQNLEKNIQTDIISLDLAKAFDSIDH